MHPCKILVSCCQRCGVRNLAVVCTYGCMRNRCYGTGIVGVDSFAGSSVRAGSRSDRGHTVDRTGYRGRVVRH